MHYTPTQLEAIELFWKKDLTEGCLVITSQCDIEYIGDMEERLLALPTIDPLSTIDEMIEEYVRFIDTHIAPQCVKAFWWLHALEELKTRLSLTQK